MTRLIERLRIERRSADDWSYDSGREDGQAWAINYATYGQLRRWAGVPTNERYTDGMPFPHDDDGAEEIFLEAKTTAEEAGEFLEEDAYARGFLDAVGEIWNKVEGEL